MKIALRKFSAVILLVPVLLINISIQEAESSANVIKRQFEAVEIPGEYFPEMLDKDISHLRLYSYQDGEFRLVPFQIDERTESLKFVMPEGREGNPGLANNLLDKQDMVVFYARYSGTRWPADQMPPGAVIGEEIELIDPVNKTHGFCYLFYFNTCIN